MSEFGRFLKMQRKARGLTMRQAAEQAGTSASRLAEIERGKSYHTDHETRPSKELVERLAIAYEVEPRVLLAEAGYPEPLGATLTSEAAKLLALYESLPSRQQRLALRLLRALADEERSAGE